MALKKKGAGLPVQHPPRIVYIGILLSALSLAAGFLTGIAALAVSYLMLKHRGFLLH